MKGIQSGDSYAIPYYIKSGDEYVTPETVDDVRIKIDTVLCSYKDGTLTYDNELEAWMFPLSEELSRTLSKDTKTQVGIKKGTKYIKYSKVFPLPVESSIIDELWD